MSGPASHGQGTWPNMDFGSVEDLSLRARCEFIQDVVRAIESRLAPAHEASRHHPAMSRRELSRRSGVGHVAVTHLLQGKTWPRSDHLLDICHAAQVKVSVVAHP